MNGAPLSSPLIACGGGPGDRLAAMKFGVGAKPIVDLGKCECAPFHSECLACVIVAEAVALRDGNLTRERECSREGLTPPSPELMYAAQQNGPHVQLTSKVLLQTIAEHGDPDDERRRCRGDPVK